MWITYCLLGEITVLRAGSSITQHAFHCWCQFWYSPSGTIENAAPLCSRTIGSLQKKDTKRKRAKIIPFEFQLEQKHSGVNILRSWGGQNQYSGLCDVAFYGLSLCLYPNFCKDDTSLFCSSEMPLRGTLEPCDCVSTEDQQRVRKGRCGLCCWSVRSCLL